MPLPTMSHEASTHTEEHNPLAVLCFGFSAPVCWLWLVPLIESLSQLPEEPGHTCSPVITDPLTHRESPRMKEPAQAVLLEMQVYPAVLTLAYSPRGRASSKGKNLLVRPLHWCWRLLLHGEQIL